MFYMSPEMVQALISERQRRAERAWQASSLRPSTRRPSLRWLAALLSAAILVAACSALASDVESPISEEQAIEMATSVLNISERR